MQSRSGWTISFYGPRKALVWGWARPKLSWSALHRNLYTTSFVIGYTVPGARFHSLHFRGAISILVDFTRLRSLCLIGKSRIVSAVTNVPRRATPSRTSLYSFSSRTSVTLAICLENLNSSVIPSSSYHHGVCGVSPASRLARRYLSGMISSTLRQMPAFQYFMLQNCCARGKI